VKEANFEDLLPPCPFDLYAYKTKFVNSTEKEATLNELWEKWDPLALSVWHFHYDKCEGEGKELHITSNLLGGFM